MSALEDLAEEIKAFKQFALDLDHAAGQLYTGYPPKNAGRYAPVKVTAIKKVLNLNSRVKDFMRKTYGDWWASDFIHEKQLEASP